ncbi:MAG: flagellar FliJ family protein [Phycisphaerales bacterium]
MAKFVFRLQSLLRARQAVERQRQVTVALLERERLALEDELRGLQRAILAEKQELREQLASRGPTRLDLRGVRFQAGASLRLATEAQQLVLRLAGAHKRLEQARAQLREAAKARRAVELLREKHYEEYVCEQKRRENAALDDIVVMRTGSNRDGTLEDAA